MANIFRNPLYTRVPPKSYTVALATTSDPHWNIALATTPAPSNVLTREPFFTRYYPARLPPDLCGFVQPSQFSLANVQPVTGFGWMDTPDQVRRQVPDISGRNIPIASLPAPVPFKQTAWENPRVYSSDRHYQFRGFFDTPLPVIPPSPGAPTTPNFYANFPNPQIPRYSVQLRFESRPFSALNMASPPSVLLTNYRTSMHIGIKLDDDELQHPI